MRFSSASLNLRIVTRGRSVKFRKGEYETESAALADAIREFATSHPNYGISEVAAGENEPENEDETSDDGEDATYDDLTVEELKIELRSRDLPVSGNRAELVARLIEDDGDEERGES